MQVNIQVVDVYIYTRIYTHIYLYIYIYVCVYAKYQLDSNLHQYLRGAALL